MDTQRPHFLWLRDLLFEFNDLSARPANSYRSLAPSANTFLPVTVSAPRGGVELNL
jgi:hypothetical protein